MRFTRSSAACACSAPELGLLVHPERLVQPDQFRAGFVVVRIAAGAAFERVDLDSGIEDLAVHRQMLLGPLALALPGADLPENVKSPRLNQQGFAAAQFRPAGPMQPGPRRWCPARRRQPALCGVCTPGRPWPRSIQGCRPMPSTSSCVWPCASSENTSIRPSGHFTVTSTGLSSTAGNRIRGSKYDAYPPPPRTQ